MTRVFVDTSFFVALLCEKDEYHGVAVSMMEDFPQPLVTTQWILAELGNYLCDRAARSDLFLLVSELESDPHVEIRPADDTCRPIFPNQPRTKPRTPPFIGPSPGANRRSLQAPISSFSFRIAAPGLPDRDTK